jgi:hypothetical protein
MYSSILPQPSASPTRKLVSADSFRNIAPRTEAFAASPESPKKRKRSEDPEGRPAAKKKTDRKPSYCPICYRPYVSPHHHPVPPSKISPCRRFNEVASRNLHIGRAICIKIATHRGLPVPASFEDFKSRNRLDSLKDASQAFEAAELKTGVRRRKKGDRPPLAGPSGHGGNTAVVLPPESLDERAPPSVANLMFPDQPRGDATFPIAVPDVQHSLPAPRSIPSIISPDAASASMLGDTASRRSSHASAASAHYAHLHLPPPPPTPLKQSASYPTLHQQRQPHAPHSEDSPGLSRSTSWIQPQRVYPTARLQTSSSFGGFDAHQSYPRPRAYESNTARDPYVTQLPPVTYSGPIEQQFTQPAPRPMSAQSPWNVYAAGGAGLAVHDAYASSEFVAPVNDYMGNERAAYDRSEVEEYVEDSGGYSAYSSSGYVAGPDGFPSYIQDSTSRGNVADASDGEFTGYATFCSQQSASPVYGACGTFDVSDARQQYSEEAADDDGAPDPDAEEVETEFLRAKWVEGYTGALEDAEDAKDARADETEGTECAEGPNEAQVSFLEALDMIAALQSETPYSSTSESTFPESEPAPDTPSDTFEQSISWDDVVGGDSSRSLSTSPWYLQLPWSC